MVGWIRLGGAHMVELILHPLVPLGSRHTGAESSWAGQSVVGGREGGYGGVDKVGWCPHD